MINFISPYHGRIHVFDGYAEPTPVDSGPTIQHFCISHHTVPKQHNKIRVVFDGANRCNDESLSIHSLQEQNFSFSEAESRGILNSFTSSVLTRFVPDMRFTGHFNGACEPMVRTIRKVLRGKVIDNCRLTDDVLHTLFIEVEGIINHRPLTKVSDDVADDHPLNPAHLLMARRAPQLSTGIFKIGDMYRGRCKYVQYLADEF